MSSRGRVLGRCCYLRLPRYGANLADSAHDSPAYCRRLEKYERRGWTAEEEIIDEDMAVARRRSGQTASSGAVPDQVTSPQLQLNLS